jgi:hypothetical protein
MNISEDKLRTVLQKAAREIQPHEVPPLRVADGRRHFRIHTSLHRWRGWLTPLAAAVSVAAVVVASLAFAGVFGSRHHPGHVAGRPGGPFAGLPPYYVQLTGPHPSNFSAPQLQSAVIRTTATGKVVATVTAPKPSDTFVSAAGAGDGRTFVLAAAKQRVTHQDGGVDVQDYPERLFRLRIGAGGYPTLTRLPVPPQPGGDLAVSPDGSKLAVGENTSIHVFDLATGAERTWTWPGRSRITNNAGGDGEVLSWTANDRTLAFQQWVGDSIDVRLLDTSTPGGDLMRASRLAVQWKGDAETLHYVHGRVSNVIFGFSAIITPDGTKIVAAAVSENQHPLASELMFTEFSAATGRPVAVLGRWRLPGLYPGQTQDVEWASRSGDKLIVLAHRPGPPVPDPRSAGHRGAAYGTEFGVQTADGFTPLPGAPVAGPDDWPVW